MGLEQRDRRPLAERAREDIARRIYAGEFQPGQRLPSEPDLARSYNVSRMTIREAIKGLQREHLLYSRRGRGTFVVHTPITHPISRLQTGTELAAELGYALTTRVLGAHVEEAPDVVAHALDVPVGTPLLCLERLRCIDDQPALYSIDRFDARWAEEDRPLGAWQGSLFSYLQQRTGRAITHTTATLRAVTLTAETSRHIGTDPHIAWFLMEQVNYDDDNHPLMYSLDYHHGDLFTFEVIRRRT